MFSLRRFVFPFKASFTTTKTLNTRRFMSSPTYSLSPSQNNNKPKMDRYRKEFWQKDLSDVAFFRTVACVIWASLGATVPVRFFTRRRHHHHHHSHSKERESFARKIQITFPQKRGRERFFPFLSISSSLFLIRFLSLSLSAIAE